MSESSLDEYQLPHLMENTVRRRTKGLTTKSLCDKILKVCELVSGCTLYPYQVEFAKRIIEAVLEREAEELSAIVARQGGKSQVLSAVSAALMFTLPMLSSIYPDDDRFCFLDPKSGVVRGYDKGFWIAVFAPKKEQASIIFKRVRAFFRSDAVLLLAEELGVTFTSNNGDTIALSNGSFIKCSTASDQSSIEGLTLHLGIMDESQDISDEKASKSIGPMMAASAGTIVKIGSANARKSHFLMTCRRNERRHRQGSKKCHFFADWREVSKYNSDYERFVMKEMIRLGERSDEFQMSYCGKFMLARGMAFTDQVFESCCVIDPRYLPYNDVMPMRRMGKHYAAGIDFGKVHDSTVVTIVEVDWDSPRQVLEGSTPEDGYFVVEIFGKHVCTWLEMQGDDYESQFHIIKKFITPWCVERIALDYTGVGQGLGDRFKAHYDGVDVEFCTFTDHMKDQLGRQLLSDVAGGFLTWPGGPDVRELREWKEFRGQMLDLEKEYKAKSGLLSLHHPDIRGAKDDYPDSLSLAVHAALTRPFGGEAEEEDNVY